MTVLYQQTVLHLKTKVPSNMVFSGEVVSHYFEKASVSKKLFLKTLS